MSKLAIYILEDEELYANQLEMLVDELDYDLAGISDNSDVAKSEIEQRKPDLLLMDVKVNGSMNGIDLAASLEHTAPVIFITSFEDQATFDRAKSTKPYAYITKPFDAENLQRTIELAVGNLEKDAEWNEDVVLDTSLFIKNRHRLEKIEIVDITYLEVEDRYSTVFTRSGKKYVLRMSMGDVQKKLPSGDFMRIHRKYTVNLNHVTSIDTQDNMIMLGEVELPISRSHKEELLNKLDWLQ
ncbi:response regulator transcription factor [Ekhidna sp.]|jgi:DNA-binding LytR/AlgR family response regulator|uniref:LytR/AlgR family response regulator transcription factor n=1 Tax=Ekhidna sp. TaxID=2608089 RepID=UPI0032EEA569